MAKFERGRAAGSCLWAGQKRKRKPPILDEDATKGDFHGLAWELAGVAEVAAGPAIVVIAFIEKKCCQKEPE